MRPCRSEARPMRGGRQSARRRVGSKQEADGHTALPQFLGVGGDKGDHHPVTEHGGKQVPPTKQKAAHSCCSLGLSAACGSSEVAPQEVQHFCPKNQYLMIAGQVALTLPAQKAIGPPTAWPAQAVRPSETECPLGHKRPRAGCRPAVPRCSNAAAARRLAGR